MKDKLARAIQGMIQISTQELSTFLGQATIRTFSRNEIVCPSGIVPNEIFFINSGLIRVIITDSAGVEHTNHFAMEGQFIADYSCYMLRQPAYYALQAIENTEVAVMPRSMIDWGYNNLRQGDRMGRLIAEYYFIYQDNRIKNLYARSAEERYYSIEEVFPNIHSRVPQHMIASYLGITAVHLSRLRAHHSKSLKESRKS